MSNKFSKIRKANLVNLLRFIYQKYPIPQWLKKPLKKKLLKKLILFSQVNNGYQSWIDSFETLEESDREKIKYHINNLSNKPFFTIILQIDSPNPELLIQSINSVTNQIYHRWELILLYNDKENESINGIIKQFSSIDPRILAVSAKGKNNNSIDLLNNYIEKSNGDFISLLDCNDQISEHALYFVALEINNFPNSNLIYSDEDKIDLNEKRSDPFFKSDWNPDLFRSQNIVSHLGVFRKSLVRDLGGFRKEFEGAHDWDMGLRISECSEDEQIRHIPRILYHVWKSDDSLDLFEYQNETIKISAQKAIISHCDRTGRLASVLPSGEFFRVKYNIIDPPPKVSFIMPSKCNLQFLVPCLESFLNLTEYTNYEVIIPINEIRWNNPEQAQYLKKIQKNDSRVRVITYNDQPFNYSKINNWACEKIDSDIIGFVNDDLEVFDPEWLTEMVSHVCRPDVAVVGAKLYYPDDTIQHAGVGLWLGGIADQRFKSLPKDYVSLYGLSGLLQNIGGVTAGCMLIKKSIFLEIGGFDENLAIKYNDIDLCHKVLEKKYRITWTPYAQLYHHESVSIGAPDSDEKRKIFEIEKEYIRKKWKSKHPEDPYYNPNLSLNFPYFNLAFPPRRINPWENI